MKKILFALIMPVLAGCTTVSDVVKVGKDTYMVTGSNNHSRSTGGEVKVELFKVANEHCLTLGKEMMPVESTSVDARLFHSSTSDLYFRCLLSSDPDFNRPQKAVLIKTTKSE